jgi:hypothetical protein
MALSSNTGSTYTYDLASHPNYLALGIPGTLNDGGNPNLRLHPVRFQMITDCDFMAGSNFQVSATPYNECGGPAVGNSRESQTVSTSVTGAETDYSVISTLAFAAGSTPMCGGSIIVEATETIVSTSPIGTNGSIEIELPQGYAYETGSYSCISSDCDINDGVFMNINGREVIKAVVTEYP